MVSGTDASFASSGHLVFWRDHALWAVRLDPDLLEMSGDPIVVLRGVGADAYGDAWYSMSREGTSAYLAASKWIAIDGTVPELLLMSGWFDELKRLVPIPSLLVQEGCLLWVISELSVVRRTR